MFTERSNYRYRQSEETPTRDLLLEVRLSKRKSTHTLFPPVVLSSPCHRPFHRPGLGGKGSLGLGGRGGPRKLWGSLRSYRGEEKEK